MSDDRGRTVGDGWVERLAAAVDAGDAMLARRVAGAVPADPGNILLTRRGAGGRTSGATAVLGIGERIVLADLGLGKDLARHAGHTSVEGGSEGLRPPELRGGPAIIDHRADLWSLSALLVWLATGTSPGTVPVAAALATTGLPSALTPVLARSLADDPAHCHPNPPHLARRPRDRPHPTTLTGIPSGTCRRRGRTCP